MKILKKTGILLTIIATALVLLFAQAVDNSFETVKNLDIYYTLIKELDTYYVDEIETGKIVKTSIEKMLETLDPYTNYIPESKIEDLRFMTTGNYGGIGTLVRKTGKRPVITDVYEGFPGQKAGIRAGDIVLKIDDFDTDNQNLEDVSEKLKGLPGTTVKVLVERLGQENPIEIPIVRESIHINPISYYEILENNVGYIQFNNFTHNGAEEFRTALDSLTKKGATSLIIDLRGNPGGLLDEAVSICNFFIPKGIQVVSTKGKMKQWNHNYFTSNDPVAPKIPVVVLVNRASASASEIVAGALQDLDRGVIIGSRTFGKGLVQTTRPLSYNAQLKITTAKYYVPSGRCIQAIDYSNRNEDGSVGTVPDSLVSEFKTKNGRKVYDGGGIKPDIETESPVMSIISTELYIDNIIFDFATKYHSTHPTIESPKDFSITDEEYQQFIDFVNNKNFEYSLGSTQKLKELVESLKEEKYYQSVEMQIKQMEELLKDEPQRDLLTFKGEVTKLINEEIVSRYHYQRGRIMNYLKHDTEIDSAIHILKNSERYNAILGYNKQ